MEETRSQISQRREQSDGSRATVGGADPRLSVLRVVMVVTDMRRPSPCWLVKTLRVKQIEGFEFKCRQEVPKR